MTMMTIEQQALSTGAVHYSPAPLRVVKGISFTYEQLDEFVEAIKAAEYKRGCEETRVQLYTLEELQDHEQVAFSGGKKEGVYEIELKYSQMKPILWVDELAFPLPNVSEELYVTTLQFDGNDLALIPRPPTPEKEKNNA